MNENVMTVRLTFTEQVLGTASNNPDVHREFIASKAPDAASREDEVAALGARSEGDSLPSKASQARLRGGKPHQTPTLDHTAAENATGSILARLSRHHGRSEHGTQEG